MSPPLTTNTKDDAWAGCTGYEPDESPIEPLTPETFVLRLERLCETSVWIRSVRHAMAEQHPEYAAIYPTDT